MKNTDEEIFIRGYWSIASLRIRTCIAARSKLKLRCSSTSMKTATTLGYYTVCLNATLPWSEPALHTAEFAGLMRKVNVRLLKVKDH